MISSLLSDLYISIVMLFLPFFLFIVMFILFKKSILLFPWLGSFYNEKKKRINLKFFECSSFSKSISYFQYDLHCFIFCFLFILYDVDMVFFISETIFFNKWDFSESFIFFFYLSLFVITFWYDYQRYILNWSN